MIRGTVFYHTQFKFKDGGIGNKLLIVLNNQSGSDPFLLCKTTSKIKYGLNNEGCYSNKNIYVIKKAPFNIPTWVQFDPNSIYPYTTEELLDDHFRNKFIKVIGCLSEVDINDIVNCFKKSEDISEYYLNLLNKK